MDDIPLWTPPTSESDRCREGAAGKEGKEGAAGKEGKEGKQGKEGKTGLSAAELETLKGILPHIKFVASGIGGKPTVQFSGINVQIVSGSGSTAGAVNGEGNLVIGYDENTGGHAQTGSHDLILGEEQTFTSFGGVVAGFRNTISS